MYKLVRTPYPLHRDICDMHSTACVCTCAQDCTVCVTAQSAMSEDMLQRGFRRFNGNAEVVSALDEVKKKAFVTFQSKSAADKAQQEVLPCCVFLCVSCVLKHVCVCACVLASVCLVYELISNT